MLTSSSVGPSFALPPDPSGPNAKCGECGQLRQFLIPIIYNQCVDVDPAHAVMRTFRVCSRCIKDFESGERVLVKRTVKELGFKVEEAP